jgi:hypothetical protein
MLRSVGENAVGRPGTIRVAAGVPGVSFSIRPHLWYTWAYIAVRQEQRAWRLRHEGLKHSEFGPYVVQEAQDAMQAVVAARHALHNLYRVWRPLLSVSGEGKIRPHHFTAASVRQGWSSRIGNLIEDRNGVVHHDEETAPARQHPQYPTSVSQLEASFTAERATAAVDVMLNEVLRPAIDHPSPALAGWAAGIEHVPCDLDARRASGDDLLP